jgi:hypothetical protein
MTTTEEELEIPGINAKITLSFGGVDDTGTAPYAMWACDPAKGRPWMVGYYTGRLKGGPFAGAFAAFAYKPVAKDQWERVYFRKFAKRSSAKQRAQELYVQHSSLKWVGTCPSCGDETFRNRRSYGSCPKCSGGVYTEQYKLVWTETAA